MAKQAPIELKSPDGSGDLTRRLLRGEVFVLRNGLQQLGLYEALVEASLEGIRNHAGPEIAGKVAQSGFDRIHEWIAATDIPPLTDRVYEAVRPRAFGFLKQIVARMFPDGGTYYFEPYPNVRFHIPFDLTAGARRDYEEFARRRGQGKISAHGPHRDSWVDCPDNAINLWMAIGPVRRGNGLSIYSDDYATPFTFRDSYIEDGQRLHPPMNFDMDPGDVLLFHGDHIHASELNRTDSTRHVISFRMTFGKPHFPNGHYHEYAHAGLLAGPLRGFATLPAKMQPSFFAYRGRWLRDRVLDVVNKGHRAPARGSARRTAQPSREDLSIPLSELPVGSIRPLSKKICVARLAEDRLVALGRRCPHMGADLVNGWIADGEIVCPWHNLHIDARTGASPCSSLRPLRQYPCKLDGDRVYVESDTAEAVVDAARAG